MRQRGYREQREEGEPRRLARTIVVEYHNLCPVEDWPEGRFAWVIDIGGHSRGVGDLDALNHQGRDNAPNEPRPWRDSK